MRTQQQKVFHELMPLVTQMHGSTIGNKSSKQLLKTTIAENGEENIDTDSKNVEMPSEMLELCALSHGLAGDESGAWAGEELVVIGPKQPV